MNKKSEIEICHKCNNKYILVETNPFGLGWENESYSCNSCGVVNTRKSAGSFTVKAIAKKE